MKTKLAAICFVVLSMSASAQSNVTTSGGTTNTVPLFTGSAAVGNSNISQSSSNVVVGTTSPAYPLDVNGATHVNGTLYVDGAIQPNSANNAMTISATGTNAFYLNGLGTGQTNVGNTTGAPSFGRYLFHVPKGG